MDAVPAKAPSSVPPEFWFDVFRDLDEAVLIWSLPAETLLFANPHSELLFGRSLADLTYSDAWRVVLHPDDGASLESMSAELSASGYAQALVRILRPDHEVRWVRARAWRIETGAFPHIRLIVRDKTESQTAKLRAELSATELRRVIDCLPGSIIVADYEQPPRLVSAGSAALTGFPLERFFELGFLDSRVHPDDLPNLKANWSMESGKPLDAEARFLDADGIYRWLQVRYQLIESGQPDGHRLMFAHCSDITAAKAVVSELELATALLEYTRKIVFRIDATGRITYVNKAAVDRLGYTREEMTSLFAWDIDKGIDPSDPAARWQQVRRNHSVALESVYRTKSGDEFPVEVHFDHVRVGPYRFLAGFATDITERKAEQAKLLSLTRALDSIALTRRKLLAATTPQNVFDAACEAVLESGQFSMAWFGLAENTPERTIRIVATAGDDHGYARNLHVSWGDDQYGMGPAGTAIRERRPVAADLATYPGYNPWRAAATACGYVSTGTIPVELVPGEWAALCVFSGVHNRFGADEIEVLERVASDIARTYQRLRSEAKFQEAQARLLSLMDALDTNVALLDTKGRVLFSNRGFAPDRYIEGGEFFGTVDPAVKARIDAARPLVLNGTPVEIEFEQTVGEKRLQIASQVRPVWIDGQVQQVVLSSRDVTAEKAAARQLAQSEEKFRKVFESELLAVLLFDAETGEILDANATALRSAGSAGMEDVNEHLPFGDPPYSAEDFLALIHKTRELGSQVAEWTLFPPGLAPSDFRIYLQSIEVGDKSVVLCLAVDITLQKRAEQRLREVNAGLEGEVARRTREVQLQALAMDAAIDGVSILHDEKYLYLNEAYARFHGYEVRELLGLSWRALYDSAEQERLWREAWPVVMETGRWVGPLRWTRRDGVDVAGEGTLRLLPGGYVISTCLEMTPRMEAQAQLMRSRDELAVANRALEQAMKMKDDFLANMSHELRTPLTGIMGMCEVLRFDLSDNMTEAQTESLDVMQSSSTHLLGLINDILDLSKIEAGRMVADWSVLGVETVVGQSLDMVKALADQKDQRILVAFESTGPNPRLEMEGYDVEVDERRIRQALVNILANAVKFSGTGTEIGFSVSRNASKGLITFEIRDHGPGIPWNQQRLLFKPFVQADSSLARATSGTGLGLSMARRIMEMHFGGIRLETEPGVGSCFSLVMPLRQVAEPPENASADHRPSNNRCVIVSFGGLAVTRYRAVLQAHGYAVIPGVGAFDRIVSGYQASGCQSGTQPAMDILLIDLDGSEDLALSLASKLQHESGEKPYGVLAGVSSLQVPANRTILDAVGLKEIYLAPVIFSALLSDTWHDPKEAAQ